MEILRGPIQISLEGKNHRQTLFTDEEGGLKGELHQAPSFHIDLESHTVLSGLNRKIPGKVPGEIRIDQGT
jgi:hypothetical protein